MFKKITTLGLLLFSALAVAADEPGSLDSTDPRNSFDTAFNLGQIDYVATKKGDQDQQLYFRCFNNNVTLNYQQPRYATYYYKFTIAFPKSRIYFHLGEEPVNSMFLDLYRGDRSHLRNFQGNDDETVDMDLSRGDYFLKVSTDPSAPHLPGPKNVGKLTFQSLPTPFPTDGPGEPIPLGNLDSPITVGGSLSAINNRNRKWEDQDQFGECPNLVAGGRSDYFDTYRLTAPSGQIRVSFEVSDRQNWSEYMLAYRMVGSTWIPITGHFDWSGGEVILAIGDVTDKDIQLGDSHVRYKMKISR